LKQYASRLDPPDLSEKKILNPFFGLHGDRKIYFFLLSFRHTDMNSLTVVFCLMFIAAAALGTEW
jgi:hypothetical protein